MFASKTHAAAPATALLAAALLAFLVWRGLNRHAPGSSPRLVWREADETDLY